MSDKPRHLRLVHNAGRKEHFEQGTGKPKISPFHPAWGNTPMEERLNDERVAEEPKPQLKLVSGGAGGGKKPPKKPTKTGGDRWEESPEPKKDGTSDWGIPPKKKPKKKPGNPYDQ